MRQFFTVLKFELGNYFKKKSFIISTVIISLLIIIGLSIPNFVDLSSILFDEDQNNTGAEDIVDEEKSNLAIYDENNAISNKDALNTYFPNSNWKVVKSQDELKKLVEDENVEAGFYVKKLTEYNYVVQNTNLNDVNEEQFNEFLKNEYVKYKTSKEGIDFDKVNSIYNTSIVSNIEILGKDSANNYMYAYILIFAL